MKLAFVVNGEVTRIDGDVQVMLRDVVREALVKSHNTGRPADDWELRHECGETITNLSRPLGEYGFVDDAYLYLTLRVGAGGDRRRFLVEESATSEIECKKFDRAMRHE